jgi:hypothetical protein
LRALLIAILLQIEKIVKPPYEKKHGRQFFADRVFRFISEPGGALYFLVTTGRAAASAVVIVVMIVMLTG